MANEKTVKRARRIVAAAIAGRQDYADLRRPVLAGGLDDSALVRAAVNALHETSGHVPRATSIVANALPFLGRPNRPSARRAEASGGVGEEATSEAGRAPRTDRGANRNSARRREAAVAGG